MPEHEISFTDVSTRGLETSPVSDALAGLRANEARYFMNKYKHTFTVVPASEAETRLRVHADIVLPASVADQTLQAVAWRHSEVLDVLRRMNQLELSQRRPLHGTIDTLDVLLMPDALGVLVPERSDHEPSARRGAVINARR